MSIDPDNKRYLLDDISRLLLKLRIAWTIKWYSRNVDTALTQQYKRKYFSPLILGVGTVYNGDYLIDRWTDCCNHNLLIIIHKLPSHCHPFKSKGGEPKISMVLKFVLKANWATKNILAWGHEWNNKSRCHCRRMEAGIDISCLWQSSRCWLRESKHE